MMLKDYKISLGMALLCHAIVIAALTQVTWSEHLLIEPKIGWKHHAVIQSYLYEPHKLKKSANIQNKVQHTKLKDGIHHCSQTHHHPKSHSAILKSNLTQGHYNQLLIALHNTIEQNQIYPSNARLLEQQGQVTLSFKLLPSGQIFNVKILKSSGYGLLDHAAKQAVVESSPFKNMKITQTTSLQLTLSYHL